MNQQTTPERAELLAQLDEARARVAALEARLDAAQPSRGELTSLLDEIEVGVWSVSAAGRTVYVNPALLRIVGRPRESFAAEKASIIPWLHPDEQEAARAVRDARFRGEAGDLEARLLRPDGEARWCRFRSHAVRDAGGAVARVDVLVFDITEQHEAEEALRRSERRFRRVLERGWDVVGLLDAGFRIKATFGSLAALTGWTEEEYDALPPPQRVHADDWPAVEATWRDALAHPGAACPVTARRPRKGGGWVWTDSVMVSLLDDPDVGAMVITTRDVSAKKAAEEALARANAELERRVAEATQSLSEVNAELVHAARAKDAFFANMSHELRTPLNAVLGITEALQEEVYGPIEERQRAALTRVEQSGRHLLSLIGDILDLAKIEAGKAKLEITNVGLAELCRAGMAMVEGLARHKRIGVSLQMSDGFASIPADDRRLKQILVNLLGNAVKFTPDGGSVGLEVTVDPLEGEARFVVWDTGIGIHAEDLPRLFKPFAQVEAGLDRGHGGTGLGLSLVRALVDLHGGSVAVESELGKGSRFTVRVPARRRTEATPARGMVRALIVEDSESAAEQLSRYLGEMGVEALVHAQAEGAVERAAAEMPAVILLDILLPAEVGWQLLRDLKADPRTSHVPVIVVSVLERRAQAIELGAADQVRKPVERDALHAAMARAMGAPKLDGPVLIASAKHGAAEAARPRRVLIAEDDEVNVITAIDFLRSKGNEVFLARDGRQAVQLAGEILPDAILMDIQMPVMDGLDAIRAIGADPRPALRRVPIVALTALAMFGDRERCLEAGADEYLSKPVGLRRLAAVLDDLTSGRR